MALTKVAEITVGSGGAASIEFTNIPQTGKDLLCVLSGRIDDNSVSQAFITFNSNDSNYSWLQLGGNGSSVFSNSNTNKLWLRVNNPDQTASTFSSSALYVANYISAANKSLSIDAVRENNATAGIQEILAGQWADTSAITAIALATSTGQFIQHSTASLYIIS
jgi:hypothetical protein